MDSLAQFKRTYFEECGELLAAAEGHLATLAEGTADPDALNAVFRSVHSIKGGAGAFGFDALVRYSHVFETAMDGMRTGRIAATAEAIGLLIRANDILADFVRAAERGEPLAADFGAEVLAALQELDGGGAPVAAAVPTKAAKADGPVLYRIRFAPGAELFRKANEPLLILRELKTLGAATITADSTRLPGLEEMEPEDAYLSWTIELETTRGEEAIREVFEFVVDDCDLVVEPVAADAGEAAPQPDEAAETVAPADVAAGPAAPAQTAAAVVQQSTPGAPAAQAAGFSSIRVDVEKVDRLVNLVGEMVIAQAMLAQQAGFLPAEQFPALIQGIEILSQHTRELQDSVMAIRAQPVKSVFARLPRLVRELGQKLGKDVRLVTTGEATEIDKTVIEQLADPLTHMIRNAIDHGIEMPDERAAKGKPRQGTIHLSAEHRSGRVIIEIADDGRGINRTRVLKKAQDKGLVPAGAVLAPEEIDNLIFLPGFSTAESVSDVSGRGVGMDVVRRNIQCLGGRVSIESVEGSGSRFVLSLPLTLAVLDAMIVAVGAEGYALPLTSIVESLRPRAQDVHPLVGRGDVLLIRGEQVPLLYLNGIFGVAGAVGDAANGIVVLVEGENGSRLGLVVDEIVGQQQVVIKSLETNYGAVDGIAAATILGNGRVALILDIARLQALHGRPRRSPAGTTAGAPLH